MHAPSPSTRGHEENPCSFSPPKIGHLPPVPLLILVARIKRCLLPTVPNSDHRNIHLLHQPNASSSPASSLPPAASPSSSSNSYSLFDIKHYLIFIKLESMLERTAEFLLYGQGQQRRAVIEALRLMKSQEREEIEGCEDLHSGDIAHSLEEMSKRWLKFVIQVRWGRCSYFQYLSLATPTLTSSTVRRRQFGWFD